MNYKNYFFSFLVIFCFAVTADEPVGSVQSENASQRSGQVSVTDQSMEVTVSYTHLTLPTTRHG